MGKDLQSAPRRPVLHACTMPAMPASTSTPAIRTCRLGRVEYVATARLQRALRQARELEAIPDVLLVLEHEPVITCGTRTEAHEVALARTNDVPIVPAERGGKATWHGPGQVVAYPIFALGRVGGDVRDLVRRLEQAIIDTLDAHDVCADRREGFPGVWVDAETARPRKVASLGLRLTRGVTFHGVAINVSCELEPFDWFTPCGMSEVDMTSVARELGREGTADAERLHASFEQYLPGAVARAFGTTEQAIGVDDLQLVAARHRVDDPPLLLPWERSVRDPATSADPVMAAAGSEVHA